MKKTTLFVLIGLLHMGLSAQNNAREYYQLRLYSLANDTQEQLTDTYLEEAFLPSLKRYGIENVGVFKTRNTGSDTDRTIYVLIPFKSIIEFALLDDTLVKDKTHQELGKSFLDAPHDRPPYARMESVLMKAFVDMPQMKTPKLEGPREDRIYELRSYEAATENKYRNKVKMFNEGGEIPLFEELGFQAVFYAEVLSGSHMPNLMYMTVHENQDSRDASWRSFREAPKWLRLKANPDYQNNVSKNDTLFLYPTEYSDY
ncbi:MAG: NIPSNAP family protein [Bacteroidota bacterium]